MGRFTKMAEREDSELDANIETAKHCVTAWNGNENDFYAVLAGVDAYFEKRFRKENPELKGWYHIRKPTGA